MSLEGQHIGEFEILERLGQGGMGAVYKARQTSLDRFVALKTLQASLAGDVDYIARFHREAKAAAGLNHPNLVQVISAGESQGTHWFAMEYVAGESARMRLKRKGRLDPLEAITIAIHVATALDFGWRKAALIHRDIKPDNIFLSGDGEVKLGDLGLAKSLGQADGLTTTGHSMGTPHYISPEQVEAMKDVDLRADIYSLGCTVYHLLSGLPPYEGNSGVAIMLKHVTAPVPNLRRVWPECPPELAAMVMKMMLKPPDARPQSYAELIAELRRVHDQLSVPPLVDVTRQPVAAQRPVAVEKKRPVRASVWVGGVVALLAAIGALVYLAPWKKAHAPPGEPHAVVSPTSNGEGGKKSDADRASSSAESTPASGQIVAVATVPQSSVAPIPTTPAPTPQPSAPSTPVPSTPPSSPPVPAAVPKPATEIEKWFAQVDGPQEEAFQKEVLKPYEAGVADLRALYLKVLDTDIAKASAAGQLAEALVWRTERQAFEKALNVANDDADTPPGVKALRAAFRLQLAKLDQDRANQAKALYAQFDAVLAKNQTLLTQYQRLDDALLLQTKREEIASAWLGSTLQATKEMPFVNRLGMKFVPVPILGGPSGGKTLLFSVWDTRVQDYEAFVKETRRDWTKPTFDQGPTHPAVYVTWDDANDFCAWLTEKDRASGMIRSQDRYRLPSDHEWSCAVGIGKWEDAAKLPSEKDGKIDDTYPWGAAWPPPIGIGNYDPLLKTDSFRYTSPVGSFPANPFGLFDMGGNVWQWCEDYFDEQKSWRVLRGASWHYLERRYLLSSQRLRILPGNSGDNYGFRCVLAPGSFFTPFVAPSAKTAGTVSMTPPRNQGGFAESTVPGTATREQPFVNSLGMNFLPVPIIGGPTGGQRLLFSIWDTRVQDYEAFAKVTGREWPKPPFEQGPTHPVANVTWEEAQLFCQWLTAHEHATGRLPAGFSYRLPSDHEWSCAVGIGAREDPAMLPAEKAGRINDEFPWGIQWPPPRGAGNFAGEEARPALTAKKYLWLKAVIPGYNDGFVNTSPVGSFAANRFGLYDMGGNVQQFCEDWFDGNRRDHVIRGSAWNHDQRGTLLSSHRYHLDLNYRGFGQGFRCVLAPSSLDQSARIPSETPRNLAADGFRSLFDGSTLAGWRALDRDVEPENWRVTDGALTGTPPSYLMTQEEFGDFELRLEWRVSSNGNGGIMYRIAPDGLNVQARTTDRAVEFQLVDDRTVTKPEWLTGSAWGVLAPTEKASHPPGQWNTARLVVQGGKVEHWINERLVCHYDLANPATRAAFLHANRNVDFSRTTRSRVALQSFGGEVYYRNLWIRQLGATPVQEK